MPWWMMKAYVNTGIVVSHPFRSNLRTMSCSSNPVEAVRLVSFIVILD